MQTKIFKTDRKQKVTAAEMQNQINDWLQEQHDSIIITQITTCFFPLESWGIGFESGVMIFYEEKN